MTALYSKRDYTFGQAILTLRTKIGLTQAELAMHLGISRRAVGDWEAGNSYPKVEHLKDLIALAVKSQAFSPGNEAQEIRALWQVAQQKVLLDDGWLHALLDQQHSSPPHLASSPPEETRTNALITSDDSTQSNLDCEPKREQCVPLQPPPSNPLSRLQLSTSTCYGWFYIALASMLVLGDILVFLFILHKSSPDLFPVLCSGKFQSSIRRSIAKPLVTSTSSDGQPIGLSRGTNIFDLQRRNPQEVQYKVQAAQQMVDDPQLVVPSLENAISSDPADAEARIYLENWDVLGSNHPQITIVVGVSFATTTAAGSRSALQGAFTAQKKCNDQNRQDPGKTQIILMIANITGNNPDDRARSAVFVANQIADQASNDPTIVAIMSWPVSTDSINVNHQLKIREDSLPMLSPSSSSDELGDRYNFFRICLTNSEQAQMAINFILNRKQKKHIAIIYDSTTSFGNNMKNDFITDIPRNVVGSESYIGGNANTLQDALTRVLVQKPDAIFFAGYVGDLEELLSDISSTAYANILLVGGDTLANTMAYKSLPPGLNHVYFTAFASANEWDAIDPKPSFFQDHKTIFGTLTTPSGLPNIDNNVMLGYDALWTLLYSSQQVLSTQNTITPSDLTRVLHQITTTHALQGITGRIAFKPNGDQQDKRLLLEHIQGTNLQIDDSQGCFLLTDTCSKR